MTDPGKILFFKFGAMGDILMTTPLIRQARRTFPDARIDYLVGAGFDVVLRNNPFLDEVITFDPLIFVNPRPFGLGSLIRRIRRKRYDLVFILDKHRIFLLAAWLGGIPRRIGFLRDWGASLFLTHGVKYGPIRHEVHYYLDLLATIAPVNFEDGKLEFNGTMPEVIPESLAHLQRPFVVCMNSGGKNIREQSALRRLPAAAFTQLAGIVHQKYDIVLLGSKDDAEYFLTLTLPPVTNLAGKLSLEESIAVMRHAKRVYTTECGALHMAATTDTPITVFFGPTHPKRRTPIGCSVEGHWADESIYDSDYEVFGRLPKGKHFFTNLDMRAIKN